MRDDIRNLPGLKQRDITACHCGKGVMHAGNPIFYRVRVEQYVVDLQAVRRQAGLEMMIGNAAIAAAFSPDEDMAKRTGSREVLVCSACAMTLPALAFLGGDDDD